MYIFHLVPVIYRSVSDTQEPLLPPSAHHHHQRLPSNSSVVKSDDDISDDVAVDISDGHIMTPNFGTYARLENRDDHSLTSLGL